MLIPALAATPHHAVVLSASFHGASFHLDSLLSAAKTTTTKAKSKTSSYTSILFIVIIGAGAYLLLGRGRQRAKMAQQQQSQIGVGDRVATSGGIIGRVEQIDGDRAQLEIAPGTTIEVMRQSIARRVDERFSSSAQDDHDDDHPDGFGDAASDWPGDDPHDESGNGRKGTS
jgi:preprotein translocase subunit YajC